MNSHYVSIGETENVMRTCDLVRNSENPIYLDSCALQNSSKKLGYLVFSSELITLVSHRKELQRVSSVSPLLCRRANARYVSFLTLYSGQFTLSSA